jgi:hypothetical protein
MQLTFTLDTPRPAGKWCIYQHTTIADGLVYIGLCRLSNLIQPEDLQKNAHWFNHVSGKVYTVQTIIVADTREELLTTWHGLVRKHRPICNLKAHTGINLNRKVKCLQTGIVYENMSRAAEENGIAASTMSNHLKGRIGYKTIHGLTFERIEK